jgi:hypothetical protein
MKTSFAVVSALVAGIGIGGFGVNSIHAQAKPPVYMIEDNTVREPQGFAPGRMSQHKQRPTPPRHIIGSAVTEAWAAPRR